MTMIPKWTRMLSALLPLILFATAAMAGDGKIRRSAHPVKDEYIVVLESRTLPHDVPAIAQRLARQHGARVNRMWGYAIKGFFATMTEARAQAMSRHPEVAYVEENAEMFLSTTVPTKATPGCVTNCTPPTTDNRLWHLDVMDQDAAVATNDFSYCTDGTDVHVYVVDTGVMRAHQEFNNDPNRVLSGYDASGDPSWFPSWNPCHGPASDEMYDPGYVSGNGGHGTGAASLVAGKTLGVARDAKIVPVKTWPCGFAGARELHVNTAYVTGEIAVNSSNKIYYQVVSGGTTGPTRPGGSSWCTSPTCDNPILTWGTVKLAYYAAAMPSIPTAQMLIDGLDWILRPSQPDPNGNVPPGGLGSPYPKSPAVVTLSTYFVVGEDGVANTPADATLSIEDAIRNLLAYDNGKGITVTASANNQGANACDTSPARLSLGAAGTNRVITVGGTMLRNNPDANPADGGPSVEQAEPKHDPSKPTRFARWRCHAGDSDICSANVDGSTPPVVPNPSTQPIQYMETVLGSNGGQCVTLFAPAKNIPVANITATNGYRDPRVRGGGASGTSWATPIVAGMAARILESNPGYTANQVRTALMSHTRAELDPLHLNPPGVTGTPNAVLQLTDVDVNDLPLTIQATNGSATINATTTSSGSFTFELYKVDALFDVAQYHRNAEKAEKVAGPQTSSSFTVSPTTNTSYFVRARSNCSTSDSTITTVVVSTPPAAPSNFEATRDGSVVNLTWGPVSNATGYRVEHKLPGATWATSGTFTTSPASVSAPSTPGGVVLYRVVATRGSLDSPPSVPDTAWVGSFTGDPAITGSTDVLGVHLVEMRKAVNGLCAAADIAPQFNTTEIADGAMTGVVVDDSASADLMARLNAARTNPAVGMAPLAFSTSLPNKLVCAHDISDLRNGVK